MSLILDALRKAESERERGSVPGLHAQPLPALPVQEPARRRPRTWTWTTIGIAVAIAISLGWYAAKREAPRAAPDAVGGRPSAEAPPLSAPAPSVASPFASPPTKPPTAIDAPAAPAKAAAPLPVAEPAPWPSDENRRAATKPPAATSPTASAQDRPAQAVGAPAPEPPIYAREQLPRSIQSELPALSISGSIYSQRAADRTLIINGLLFHENDRLNPDLQLEQIRQKSAVLRYKGYRFEVMF